MTTLRARQRRQTSEEIRRVAVDLIFEHGLDSVTTEMISEAAGVSPRTFFNYFPYKEAALIPPKEDFPDEAIALFLSAQGPLEDDLVTLVIPMTSLWETERTMLKKLFAMADSHPKLSALKAISIQEHEMEMRALMALRLGQQDDDYTPTLIAAVVVSALRVAMENWAEGAEGTTEDCVRRALGGVRTMFGPH